LYTYKHIALHFSSNYYVFYKKNLFIKYTSASNGHSDLTDVPSPVGLLIRVYCIRRINPHSYEMVQVFDKHNRGYISASDLRAVLQCLGEDLSEEESK
jgi:hypothetical protein